MALNAASIEMGGAFAAGVGTGVAAREGAGVGTGVAAREGAGVLIARGASVLIALRVAGLACAGTSVLSTGVGTGVGTSVLIALRVACLACAGTGVGAGQLIAVCSSARAAGGSAARLLTLCVTGIAGVAMAAGVALSGD